MAKRINTLLRHGELPREEDGAIEFWRLKDDLQNSTLNIGLMMYGRARWQEAEATIKDFNIVLTRQDKKFSTFELFECRIMVGGASVTYPSIHFFVTRSRSVVDCALCGVVCVV